VFSVVTRLALQPRPGRIDSLEASSAAIRTGPIPSGTSRIRCIETFANGAIFDSLLAHPFSLVGIGDSKQ
jgi:hypothetical protein